MNLIVRVIVPINEKGTEELKLKFVLSLKVSPKSDYGFVRHSVVLSNMSKQADDGRQPYQIYSNEICLIEGSGLGEVFRSKHHDVSSLVEESQAPIQLLDQIYWTYSNSAATLNKHSKSIT